MSGKLTRKYALPPSAGRNPYDWFGRGGIEEWVGQTCSSSPGPSAVWAPGCTVPAVVRLQRRAWFQTAVFSPRASTWADAGVGALAWFLCLCLQLPLLSTARGEVMASCSLSSLPLHLEPSQPRSTVRYSGVAAALLSARRMPTSGAMLAVQLC